MKLRLVLACALGIFLGSCESGPDYNALYRLEKQYWDVNDYQNAIYKIHSTVPGTKKPCYAVPELAPVFTKLVDKTNVSVIVEDEVLGVKHRYEYASDMFDHTRNMLDEYSVLDREDKYEYPMELVDVLVFHLYTQLHYFDLGNQNILKEADDPNEASVKNVIANNEQTLVNNFTLTLDYVNHEDAFTSDALDAYVAVLDEYFPPLIANYPNVNYNEMKEKATDMNNKAKSEKLKAALTNIIAKIDANAAAIQAAKMAVDSTTTVQ